MNVTGGTCGSPSTASMSETGSDTFMELWSKLKESHDKEVQGLQVKISKLKKERCLDAQRLDEYYSKNQQLREQLKALHDNVKILEDRLRAGLCDRCAVTDEHMRKKQQEFENIRQQNLKLISELMAERNNLQDENKKLIDQLQKFCEQTSKNCESEDNGDLHEEGIIPDSPLCAFSVSMVNRMRRKKEGKHVRYIEQAPADSQRSPSAEEPVKIAISTVGHQLDKQEILVVDTCDPSSSPIANTPEMDDGPEKPRFNLAAVVAETIGLGIQSSDSIGYLKAVGEDTDVTQLPQKTLERTSRRLQVHESEQREEVSQSVSDNLEKMEQDSDWVFQQCSSPVFGTTSDIKSCEELEKNRSPVFGEGVRANLRIAPIVSSTSSKHHKLKDQPQEVSLISPVHIETGQSSACEQRIVKTNTNELYNCGTNAACRTSDEMPADKDNFPTNLGKPSEVKVKKMKQMYSGEENDLSTKCENTMFNKENYTPLKMSVHSTENGDCSLDKPLDLSDRLSDSRNQDKNHGKESKNKLRQATLFDSLKANTKISSSLHKQKAYNGGCASSKDTQDDPYLQEAVRRSLNESFQDRSKEMLKEDVTAFRVPQPISSFDTNKLFDDVKVSGVPKPIRKKARIQKNVSETSTVLHPNLCASSENKSIARKEEGNHLLQDMWSIDPGADLSQYKTDATLVETKTSGLPEPARDSPDMDSTYISETVLKLNKHKENNRNVLNESRDDSLEEIFDRTAYGNYDSCPKDESPTKMSDQDEDSLEIGGERMLSGYEENPSKTTLQAFVMPYVENDSRKNRLLNFPHIEVVRNKEERRKMLGHTCKECEVYYADLPEEERKKKLAACSRHRFRYIPPGTPENFWEVGFPSTQTCKDRGYIKEDIAPCQRPRRRRPYHATFSTKGKEQKR
ncbi:DNA endonuclease RBBP8 [Protopterus annectens]|uniref:DNA endonuclease RBBP8 n=1 Tax=Protopterus annectens TaxID=7888 RepID=UPI001CFA02B8|nr:DNA endonuclease RBBP8 [Protopterus annectens]XP_043921301.1 DNA endonuclease RBBP8 [Protopterus annectens]XP_043921303.1 DNA endonuclease RBBP8 [Protopterus annectens]